MCWQAEPALGPPGCRRPSSSAEPGSAPGGAGRGDLESHNEVLGWTQAKGAEPLGGPKPDINPIQELDPVVAEAVDGLCILVGQHKTADQRYRAAIAKELTILKRAGYQLDPDDLHTHARGHGWRATHADILRDVATRINAGRIIHGMKTAPLRDDVLEYWRAEAAIGHSEDA